jgi:two-component system, OmpR family, sensor histidine kinase KdpD
VLTSMAEALLRGEGGLPQLLELVRETFGLEGLSVLQRRTGGTHEGGWTVTASCGTGFPEWPEQATVQAELDASSMLSGRGPALSAADLEIFTACAAQIAEYLGQRKLSQRAAGAEQQAQSARMRTAMAAAAGRALVDGVDSARRAVAALRAIPTAAREGEPIDTLEHAVDRIGVLANQLEDVAKARAGALDVRIRQVDVAEVVAAALEELGPGRHAVDVVVPEDLPNVISDAAVLTRVITALAANAIRLSSPGGTPKITAARCGDRVEIRFQTTCLKQVPAKGRGDYFTVEAARDLLEAIDASLRTEGPDSAPTVIISVAAADPVPN